MDKQHLIIGSAGHIDHGKSSIIKELTNIDPTRLKEEKERNITIDLGFSYMFFNDKTVAFIDLPGHEKFIANMIVGSSNIDMILFVIAADDGIMPQTIEHFEILSLLNIKHALIVLNKVDLVSQELLEQREQEINSFFKNTNFENAPIVKTSIYDNSSITRLKDTLMEYISNNQFKHREFDIFRMAIDRCFSMKGLGTIVTGTSQGKELFVNEELEIYPSRILVKVKNIQNHNQNVNSITSGYRTALQLSKISKDEIKRGDFIASPNSLRPARYLDVIIRVLKSSKGLRNNQLIRVSHQTKELIGRLKLANTSIKAGSSSFATIVLQSDIYALKNDLAIIRSFSPIKTIAGIEIINMYNEKVKINEEYYNKYLNDSIANDIINYLDEEVIANEHQILQIIPKKEDLISNLEYLLINNKVIKFEHNNKNAYINNSLYSKIKATIIDYLNEFHANNPLYKGCNLLELYNSGLNYINYKVFKSLIKTMDELIQCEDVVALKSFKINYTNEQKARKNAIITYLKNNGYSILSFEQVNDKFNSDLDNALIKIMIINKELIIIDNNYLILDRMYFELIKIINTLYLEKEKILLADFKKELAISRKYCILYLEHFDRELITKRIDDYRIIYKINK